MGKAKEISKPFYKEKLERQLQEIEPRERLCKVLEWLYVNDGTYKNKNEWRDELVWQMYYLAGIKYPDTDDEGNFTSFTNIPIVVDESIKKDE